MYRKFKSTFHFNVAGETELKPLLSVSRYMYYGKDIKDIVKLKYYLKVCGYL